MGAQVEKMHADTIITKMNKYIFFITNYYLSSCPDTLVEGVIRKLAGYFESENKIDKLVAGFS